MPEGHTVHRHAREIARTFSGHRIGVDSPQGRFDAGAARLDDRELVATEAHGKHLFAAFGPVRSPATMWLHVHLGLYGKWVIGRGEPPAARGALRLRMVTLDADEPRWAELRGPIACEVLTRAERRDVMSDLGPDPLRTDADPGVAHARVARSRQAVGQLLMRQDVISGIGNVYRAEVLFRAGISPHRPGRGIGDPEWAALWTDLVTLMRTGVRSGRIVTTRPEHRSRRSGTARSEDAHYVYRRAGRPCRVCGTPVATEAMAGRNLFWCRTCQAV